MNEKILFLKVTILSEFLISQSNLFHSIIVEGKSVCLKKSCFTFIAGILLRCLVLYNLLCMCSCDQSLVTVAFLWKKLSQPQFYKHLTRKTTFFEGWSWFKFNNLGVALGTNLKFYTSVEKGLKLKVRKSWGLIPTFAEVTVEKPVGRTFLPPILNRVKKRKFFHIKIRIDSWVKRRWHETS